MDWTSLRNSVSFGIGYLTVVTKNGNPLGQTMGVAHRVKLIDFVSKVIVKGRKASQRCLNNARYTHHSNSC